MATSLNYQMEVEDSEFRCPLCFEIFEEPKSFPTCAHTFCKGCLSRLVSTKDDLQNVECPVCRQSSPLPSRGVDGFPTNTFIVRLMEKIPGIQEKKEIAQAVARCRDEIERNKKVHENIQKHLDLVKKNKQLAEELKKQISSHATEYVEAIKKCEEKLCKDVDECLKKTCGGLWQREFEKETEKLDGYLEVAQNCVFNVEDMINQEDLSEIPAIKEVIHAQLKEYSKYPEPSVVEEAASIQAFDVVFDKSEIKADVLGKTSSQGQMITAVPITRDAVQVSSHTPSTAHASWGLPAPRLPVQNTAQWEEWADESPIIARESEVLPSVDPRLHVQNTAQWEELSDESPIIAMKSEVLYSVDLPFCPSKIAVRSALVALLWKEMRKVHLYNTDGEFNGIIHIKYGTLTDVGFDSDLNVVVVNRENNRLIFYDRDGHFLYRKVRIPTTNLKYTYLSVDSDGRLLVVSTLSDDENDEDNIDPDEITKCIVVYEANGTLSKVFGRGVLEHPVSRAVFHLGKFFVADLICETQVHVTAVRTFTSDFTIAETVVTMDNIHGPNIPFVSLFDNPEADFMSPSLLIGRSDTSFVYVVAESGECVERRYTDPAKQQEKACCKDDDDNVVNDRVQAEIYSSRQLFQIVQYYLSRLVLNDWGDEVINW